MTILLRASNCSHIPLLFLSCLSWQYSPKAHTWVRPEAANILGALDLGGASTQISFIPKGSVINWNETSRFMLYGYNYNIYTHSYLCYGQNEMVKRLAKELILVRGEQGGNQTTLGIPSTGLLTYKKRKDDAFSERHQQGLRAGTEMGREAWGGACEAPEGEAQERSSACMHLPCRRVQKRQDQTLLRGAK